MSDTSDPFPPWPSYHGPLAAVREKVRVGGDLTAAIEALGTLRTHYRHVQAIGHELVLALLQAGRQHDAVRQLEALEQQFSDELDEETRCRRGRVYKEAADASDSVQAETWYRQALERYHAAYAIRQGHYPGINKASTLLLLAAVAAERKKPQEADALIGEMRALVTELLARRDSWPREQGDDNIWHLLTEAEAYLLLRRWSDAEAVYRRAVNEPNIKPFHGDSARKQAQRILHAWRGLQVEPGPPVFPLAELFPPPVEPAE